MTVILVLLVFVFFIILDYATGKHPLDIRTFDHSNDGFANLGVTMADGGILVEQTGVEPAAKLCP